jgi:hypothetical protein
LDHTTPHQRFSCGHHGAMVPQKASLHDSKAEQR